jgi:hypothetical protein
MEIDTVTRVDLTRNDLFSRLRNSGVKIRPVRINGHFLAPWQPDLLQDLIMQLPKENTSEHVREDRSENYRQSHSFLH